MGGKSVSNFIIPINDIKKEYEFEFYEEIDQKTVQLCSKLRQNRLHLADIAKLEQELKSLRKEKFINFAKLVPVPLPRGRNIFRRKLYRRPAEVEDEVSFKKLLLEVPNFVYGIVHQCKNSLIVNLDMAKLCTKPSFLQNQSECQMCQLWKCIFGKNERTKQQRILKDFVDSGNGLRTVFFQEGFGKLFAFADSTLTEHKGRQAYQTYVTIDCKGCESAKSARKFPVNGFPYNETRTNVKAIPVKRNLLNSAF